MMRAFILTTLFTLGTTAQAMDYTNGYALETTDGTHVGFVLGSPSFKVEAGDCVFMFLPQKTEAANSALGLAVSELKVAGEHTWKKSGDAILIQNGNQTLLTISASAEVVGRDGAIIGKAIAMPERK
jgi:hypothetical protein